MPRATQCLAALERSSGRGRTRRCTLENILQIVIMVDVEPANGQDLLGTFELTSDEAVFTAGVCPQCQSPVSPQLYRLVRKRLGVCIRAINRAARMGPIAGICRSNLMAGCFSVLPANSSRRVPWRNAAKASRLLVVEFGTTANAGFQKIFASHSAR